MLKHCVSMVAVKNGLVTHERSESVLLELFYHKACSLARHSSSKSKHQTSNITTELSYDILDGSRSYIRTRNTFPQIQHTLFLGTFLALWATLALSAKRSGTQHMIKLNSGGKQTNIDDNRKNNKGIGKKQRKMEKVCRCRRRSSLQRSFWSLKGVRNCSTRNAVVERLQSGLPLIWSDMDNTSKMI
jgi:hypothetical protein